MYHSQVSKPVEEEGGCDSGMSLWISLAIEIATPMIMVHPPPGIAWPQEIPWLAPWVLSVSIEQSSCECSRVSDLHPHPWSHHLFPFVDDQEIHLAIVFLHVHIHDRVSLCVITPKTCLLISYIKKHNFFLNNSKIKSGFWIHYLFLHKPLLVVGACMGIYGSWSLHRDSHLWWWYFFSTMERTLLGRG